MLSAKDKVANIFSFAGSRILLCSTIGLWFTAGRQSLTRQK
jgi:hypothetical protein